MSLLDLEDRMRQAGAELLVIKPELRLVTLLHRCVTSEYALPEVFVPRIIPQKRPSSSKFQIQFIVPPSPAW